jgi:hypothetical protein
MKKLAIAIGMTFAFATPAVADHNEPNIFLFPTGAQAGCTGATPPAKQGAKMYDWNHMHGGKEVECGSIYAAGHSGEYDEQFRDRHFGVVDWYGSVEGFNDQLNSMVLFNKTKASNEAGVCFIFFDHKDFDGSGNFNTGSVWVEGKPDSAKYRIEVFPDLPPGMTDLGGMTSSALVPIKVNGVMMSKSQCLSWDEHNLDSHSSKYSIIVY